MSPPSSANSDTRVKKSSTCTNCRERHLKCDGLQDCSRCKLEKTPCKYVASRRGQRKPSSSARRHDAVGALLKDGMRGPNTTIWTTPIVSGGQIPDFSVTIEDEKSQLNPARGQSPVNKLERTRTALSVHLLSQFYSYFFHAHPFVLPRAHLSEKFAKNDSPQLQAAVEFVGACYDPAVNRTEYADLVSQRLFLTSPPRDGFSVQAMLLAGIALHGNNEKERALDTVRRAATLALEIGMNLPSFATANGNGDVVLEESWRRTFWEVFIVERVLAAEIHNPESILITLTPVEVPLPCEEAEYLSGTVYRRRTLEDYDNRAFLGENIVFSSYAYRIDAARILANALPLAYTPYPDDAYIQKIDYELAQWCLYLPSEKRKVISSDGVCDEVLFHAHALTFWAGMFLHRPRSTLARTKLPSRVLDCFPPVPFTGQPPDQSATYHTAFILKAADSVVKLGNMPRNTLTHTPLFNFCLLLSASTHLAVWPCVRLGQTSPRNQRALSYAPSSSDSTMEDSGSQTALSLTVAGSEEPRPFTFTFEDDPNNLAPTDPALSSLLNLDQAEIKDRVRLLLGSLKRLGQIWPSARIAMEEIQQVSMQLFASAISPPKSSPATDSMYEAGSSSTDTMSQHTSNSMGFTTTFPPAFPASTGGQSPAITMSQPTSQPEFNMFDALNQASFLSTNFYGGNPSDVQASYSNDGSVPLNYGGINQMWQGE